MLRSLNRLYRHFGRYAPIAVLLLTSSGVVLAQAGAGSPTINNVPFCDGQDGRPAHDPSRWHALVERNADGKVVCTYGHEHGMNPTLGDAVFGPLNAWGAQEISYPWATISAAGIPENGPDLKHRAYKWEVVTNLPCTDDQDVTAMRGEFHNDGNLGAVSRFHSYWVEAQLSACATGEKGYISMGGHMDFANLQAGDQVVPIPGGPLASCALNGDARGEGRLGGLEQSNSVWYGANNHATLAGSAVPCDDDPGFLPHVNVNVNIGTNSWGPVDPANPSALYFYADRGRHNGTMTGSDVIGFGIDPQLADSTGHVNLHGFVNRHGVVLSNCSPVGPDCVPLTIQNARPGGYYSALPNFPLVYSGDVPGPQGQAGYYVQTPGANQ